MDFDMALVARGKSKRIAQKSCSSKKRRIYKKKLALLLPAHNEELIIQATIRAALAAGQNKQDIFVVDDCSSDSTRDKAIALLGKRHVLTVKRSGKAKAVYQAIQHFKIEQKYIWLHVADSDSVFCPDYFRLYRRKLDSKYAVAVGFVQSLRGNWISNYRALNYTYSQHIQRRAQSWFGMISVFPGPITSFRTNIIKDLDFTVKSLTEDFDLTLQVHRKSLGRIRFIPEAINYTQDPQTLRDFCNQTARWQRGFFQGIKKYRIGTRLQIIDASIGYQMLQMMFFLIEMFGLVPLAIWLTGRWMIIPALFVADFMIVCLMALFSASITKRAAIISSLPYFYFLRWVEIGIFLKSFVEVIILKRFNSNIKGWKTANRRYALDSVALKDTAR